LMWVHLAPLLALWPHTSPQQAHDAGTRAEASAQLDLFQQGLCGG